MKENPCRTFEYFMMKGRKEEDNELICFLSYTGRLFLEKVKEKGIRDSDILFL